MDIIGAVKLDGQYEFYEADYLYFVLDLDSRLDDSIETCRNDLGVVSKANAVEFIEYMRQYLIDMTDLHNDYRTLAEDELVHSRAEFLPTVLIDFDDEVFLSSHPDDQYLNFSGYLPAPWKFEFLEDLTTRIPTEQAYWKDWVCKKGSSPE